MEAMRIVALNLHTGEVGDEFPAYAGGTEHRLLDLVGAAAGDDQLKMFVLSYDPGWRID